MLLLGLDDKLPNFRVDLSLMDATAERVIAITNQAYPSLDIPFHSRWRHFVVGGVDRFEAIAKAAAFKDAAARARAEFDLAIVSVFLDAGAGRAMALRRPRKRPEHRPLRRPGAGQPRHVHARRVFRR